MDTLNGKEKPLLQALPDYFSTCFKAWFWENVKFQRIHILQNCTALNPTPYPEETRITSEAGGGGGGGGAWLMGHFCLWTVKVRNSTCRWQQIQQFERDLRSSKGYSTNYWDFETLTLFRTKRKKIQTLFRKPVFKNYFLGQNARCLVLGHSMAIVIDQIHVIVFTLVYLEYK